jgi:molybdopterin converting factor subunit 1
MIVHEVLLFAGLAELCGAQSLHVEVDAECSVAALQDAAAAACPALAGQVYRVAVDSRYVTAETILPPRAEIAFIPPVSGG